MENWNFLIFKNKNSVGFFGGYHGPEKQDHNVPLAVSLQETLHYPVEHSEFEAHVIANESSQLCLLGYYRGTFSLVVHFVTMVRLINYKLYHLIKIIRIKMFALGISVCNISLIIFYMNYSPDRTGNASLSDTF